MLFATYKDTMNVSKFLRILVVVLYMSAMFVVSHIPGNRLVAPDFLSYDKLLHLLEYMIFGFLIAWALAIHTPGGSSVRKTGLVLIVGWGYAMLDEIHQYFVPSRSMDILDFAADAIGVILGVGLYLLIVNTWSSKISSAS